MQAKLVQEYLLLEEKLPLSIAKEYTKISNNKYKTLLNDVFGNKYRIYIPLNISTKDVDNSFAKTIEKYIKAKIGDIEHFDYIKGYVKKDKQLYSIGRLIKDFPELLKVFSNDPLRSSGSLLVVISKHPYDIAGMSTDRAWPSCMDISKGTSQSRYVKEDIKHGTLIAYLISNQDKNINRPLARILLKPYTHTASDGKKLVVYNVGKLYGLKNDYFIHTVKKWVKDNINSKVDGLYHRNKELYPDSNDPKSIRVGNPPPRDPNNSTLKKRILDFVENEGSATWKEIHSFILAEKDLDPNYYGNRGYFSSYFSPHEPHAIYGPSGRSAATHGLLMRPTWKDPRYLSKTISNKYIVRTWDGINELEFDD